MQKYNRKTFNGFFDKRDLILGKIALILKFYSNITSEILINKYKLWFCNYDLVLKYGLIHANTLSLPLKKLKGLPLFEYKPIPHSFSIFPTSIFLFGKKNYYYNGYIKYNKTVKRNC